MINNVMKLADLLLENSTDLVAKYYIDATKSFDERYNTEAAINSHKNQEYYKEYFKEWYKNGTTPVFEKPGKPTQSSYDHNPKKGVIQSPGYRGKQNALKAAGLPYNKYTQDYDPSQAPSGIDDTLNT